MLYDMFCKTFLLYAVLETLYSTVFASPTPPARDDHGFRHLRTLADVTDQYPQLSPLEHGNAEFRNNTNPDLLQRLTTDGQHPEYLFLGCR